MASDSELSRRKRSLEEINETAVLSWIQQLSLDVDHLKAKEIGMILADNRAMLGRVFEDEEGRPSIDFVIPGEGEFSISADEESIVAIVGAIQNKRKKK